jgi:nucleoside phosphorylase
MICYAFAIQHESEDFLKGMTDKESFSIGHLSCTVGRLGGQREVLVACVGMGLEAAGASTDLIFQYFRVKAFVFAGYGGALVPQLRHGTVVVSENFTTGAVLNFVRLLPDFQFARFCSTDEVITSPERRKEFADSTHCQVVDMETAAVAERVHSRELPFLAARAITDTFDSKVDAGVFNAAFNRQKCEPTPARLAFHLALHPWKIGPFRSFVSGLESARQNLTRFLLQLDSELPSAW